MSSLKYYTFYIDLPKELKRKVFIEVKNNIEVRRCEFTSQREELDTVFSSSIYPTKYESQPLLGEADIGWVLDNHSAHLIGITYAEFEAKWQIVLDNNMKNWQQIKSKFPVTSDHIAKTIMFYPQGTLLTKESAIFLMEDEDYQTVVPIQNRYPNTEIKVKVVKHIENTQWLYAQPTN